MIVGRFLVAGSWLFAIRDSRFVILFLFCLLSAIPTARAADIISSPIIADLAVRSVDIDHNFTGLEILMFGARNDAGRLVVVLRGPEKSYVVRKKARVAGIWVNRDSMEFHDISGFYSIASTGILEEIRNDSLLATLKIGQDSLIAPFELEDDKTREFWNALVADRRARQLYGAGIQPVHFWGETLFRTVLKFPKTIEPGWYTAEIYLFSDGLLKAVQSTPVHVSKVGFEAFLHDLAQRRSLLYGLLCVAMAASIGWLANLVMRRR